MTNTSGTEAPLVDKRRAKALGTRQAIIDAVVALQAEGVARPRAEQIAERAGISRRSVFQHFPDREKLVAAVFDALQHRIGLPPPPREDLLGDIDMRLDRFLDRRVALLEAITPHRRAANLLLSESRTIAERRQQVRVRMRDEIRLFFRPEIQGVPARRRGERLDALAALADWEMWESLRGQWGHPPARARRILRSLILASLRFEGPDPDEGQRCCT